MKNQATLIIGANSEIAKAIAEQVIMQSDSELIVISRNIDFYLQRKFKQSRVISIESYQKQDIELAVERIRQYESLEITQVFICHGLLHNSRCQPEKRIDDFTADAFVELMTANTITPMLWLQHLMPVLKGQQECRIVIFSARVGSISDNKLGGWYSYRASKAALNMLIKSASIEFARRAKNIKLISFHPGTTDSPLSKPFQKNVPNGKVFTSEFVARQLLNIVKHTDINGEASYLDWQGKEITW